MLRVVFFQWQWHQLDAIKRLARDWPNLFHSKCASNDLMAIIATWEMCPSGVVVTLTTASVLFPRTFVCLYWSTDHQPANDTIVFNELTYQICNRLACLNVTHKLDNRLCSSTLCPLFHFLFYYSPSVYADQYDALIDSIHNQTSGASLLECHPQRPALESDWSVLVDAGS